MEFSLKKLPKDGDFYFEEMSVSLNTKSFGILPLVLDVSIKYRLQYFGELVCKKVSKILAPILKVSSQVKNVVSYRKF